MPEQKTPRKPALRRTMKVNQRKAGRDEPSDSRKPDKKKVAVGALLTFYRHLRDVGRKDLAGAAGVSVSLLGMIENASRLPSHEVLEKLGAQLQLTPYQRLQLHAIAGYSAPLPEAPGWEVRADDLITGVPLFLRNMKLEYEFQGSLDIEEAWVVTRRPLALEEPVFSMLKNKLLNTDANYVYFVDERFGKHDFETLWNRLGLESDDRWKKKKAKRVAAGDPEQLTFVLSPPTLCAATHTLALFNPRSATRPRFGRAVYYGGGAPIGVYALDLVLYEQLASLLKEVYIDCEKNPEQPFPMAPRVGGTFTMLKLHA
jgi:transcriptional regulator with XRE-family HTH domain